MILALFKDHTAPVSMAAEGGIRNLEGADSSWYFIWQLGVVRLIAIRHFQERELERRIIYNAWWHSVVSYEEGLDSI